MLTLPSFGPSARDSGIGFLLQIEKDVNLSQSTRLKMHPNINVSFLFSNHTRKVRRVLPPRHYLNAISFSPKVSYEVIAKKRFKIAPYANLFTSFLLGLKADIFFAEPETIDTFKWGIEGGLRVDIILEKTTIRLIPVALQRSVHDYYQQGMISLMVEI